MSVAPIEDRRVAAIALMIAATVINTGIDTCAKWLANAGLPATEVVFIRYAAHMALALALFWPTLGVRLFRTRALPTQLARGAALLVATILNFVAVKYLPLTVTASILFTMPLWICLLSIPMLGERVGPRRWIAVLTGFGGVLIITRPWSEQAHWAMLLSLGMAIGAALYSILSRRLAGVDSTATQQFYAAAVATLGVAPVAFLDWRWPTAELDWVAFGMIGVFGWGGHQLMTLAHRLAPASALAPFGYAQILFMTVSSWAIFHTPPDRWTVVGAAVVIGSGLYIGLRERRRGEGA